MQIARLKSGLELQVRRTVWRQLLLRGHQLSSVQRGWVIDQKGLVPRAAVILQNAPTHSFVRYLFIRLWNTPSLIFIFTWKVFAKTFCPKRLLGVFGWRNMMRCWHHGPETDRPERTVAGEYSAVSVHVLPGFGAVDQLAPSDGVSETLLVELAEQPHPLLVMTARLHQVLSDSRRQVWVSAVVVSWFHNIRSL